MDDTVEPKTASASLAACIPMDLPAEVQLSDLHGESLRQLAERARSLRLRVNPDRSRRHLILDLLRAYGNRGTVTSVDGVLDLSGEHHGFLRSAPDNFRPGPDDPYVPPALISKFGLRSGNLVAGRLGVSRDRDKHLALDQVTAIEGRPVETWAVPTGFDELTPMFPSQRILLENNVAGSISVRAMDLITPLGRGQRALIVAPPRTGKTI
ncbi:MAG: transcription termination factor Rho, partial [Opitutaceae bacterium]|nr:transcription termination factor Rho [Verrucomicrobiales bacterium]